MLSWYRDYANTVEAQSPHLFTELSDYHTCWKTPDYKYWMPTLVEEITVLQKMWTDCHFIFSAGYVL